MGKLIAVVGTTASGKSDLGIELAKHYGGEIVSADSRQVYRGMDLGTGKVTKEEMAEVKHHLIDIIDPNTPFSMAEFQSLAYGAIDGILERGKLPFLVGGTGLYTRSVVEGYQLSEAPPDPELRRQLSEKTPEELRQMLREAGEEEIPMEYSPRRMIRMLEKYAFGDAEKVENCPRYEVLQFGLTYPREELYERIAIRLDRRIADGMVEEIQGLMEKGATPEFLEGLGLEYRMTYRYLSGAISDFATYRDTLYREICHFAKRQMTWFRKEKNILWLNPHSDALGEAISVIDRFLE